MNKKLQIVAGSLISVGIIFAYSLLTYNKFFPITEGWWSVFSHYILNGQVPYRDFYMFLPPAYPLLITKFISLFGYNFIYLRILGVILTALTTGLLFLIFNRITTPVVACFVTIGAMVCYQAFNAFIPYDYNEFVTFFILLMVAGFLSLTVLFHKKEYGYKFWGIVLCIGLLNGIVLMTKQNVGFLTITFSGVIFVVLRLARARALALYFVAGILIALFFPILWLARNGAWSAFFQQVFLDASSSKGGLFGVFFAWIPRLLTAKNIKYLVFFIILLAASYWRNFFPRAQLNNQKLSGRLPENIAFFGVLLACATVIFPIFFIDAKNFGFIIGNGKLLKSIAGSNVAITAFFSLGVIIYSGIKIFKKQGDQERYFDLFVIGIFGLVLQLSCGMSTKFSEFGAVLFWGLTYGTLLCLRTPWNIGRVLVVGQCLIGIFFFAYTKEARPYAWWGVESSSVREAVNRVEGIPFLEGFYLSAKDIALFKKVNSAILSSSQKNDSVFIFPHMPIFYLMNDRYPGTFALVHWYDVAPDKVVLNDLEKISGRLPKVFIILDDGGAAMDFHEQLFRGSKISGQRKLWEAMDKLTRIDKKYSLIEKIGLTPDVTLSIWKYRKI